jgi:hypothetical protein
MAGTLAGVARELVSDGAPGYAVDDPLPIAAGAPYTFYLPSAERLAAIMVGDQVKLIIRGVPPGTEYDAERMWVSVTAIDGDAMVGALDNQPFDISQLKPGDEIRFRRSDIIDATLEGDDRDRIGLVERREYWERCLVDNSVICDGDKVGYVYREEPDMTDPDDKYPDSGWRIRGESHLAVDGDEDGPTPKYIALGAVLNCDDSWLSLIDAPVGSAFMRNVATGEFVPYVDFPTVEGDVTSTLQ